MFACDDSSPTPPEAPTPAPAAAAPSEPAAKKPEVKAPAPSAPTAKAPAEKPPAVEPAPVANEPATPTPQEPARTKPPVSKKPKDEPPPSPPAEVVTAPASDVPPELQKYAQMAASPKFREFTALAAERHTLQLRASQLRLEMRGTVPTDAQQAEVAAVQQAVGKAGDRMDEYVTSKTWTQDELITMDFIISEQMRLRPPPG